MLLGDLLKSVSKKYKKINEKNICFDSRKIKKNDIFFSIKGNRLSGDKFINDVISAGASVIITSKKVNTLNKKFPQIVVKNVRKKLSEVCSNYYKNKPTNIVAVTGTNGKSSIVDFFSQILALNKKPVGSIGTLGIISKNYKIKTKLTSVDPLLLHKSLDIFYKKKINNVILEASSHGLDQNRLDYLNFKTGIFTNLSHDHLDYHKNMKAYLDSKMYLFRALLKKNSNIVADQDNKEFKIIKNVANKKKIKILSIGSKSPNIKILFTKYQDNKQIIKISINSKVYLFQTSLIGFFQIKNLLMAILAAISCGVKVKKIISKIHQIKSVSGRLECVAKLKNNSKVIVDFAHTPEALKQTLIALKQQFNKEIIIVFGCGGDRDQKKRLTMGKIAKKYCRKIFVTDDNPRNENPKKIRSDILKGCRNLAREIGSRRKAIKEAIYELKSNEILLVAGKGHENKQDYGNKIINFSDKKVIIDIIKDKKNSFIKTSHKDFLLKKAIQKNIKNINYKGVSINSRTIKKNELFFAIRGKFTDGHNFLNQAIKKKAIRCIVDRKVSKVSNNKVINVKNTFFTLKNLAKITRNYTNSQIIGITGSTGKTTLKNLMGFALKNYGKVYHSPMSYNNKYGVPLSVCNLKENTEYGIFEIGMDKKGEINYLSKIVRPEIAVITNISEAHIKNFNTIKDIAKAKGEIIYNIQKGGSLILNKDDKFFSFFKKKAQERGINVISFSSKKNADIFLSNVIRKNNYYKLKVIIKNKTFYFSLKNSTDNFINNILACISVISALDLNLNEMKNFFRNFKIPNGRGDICKVKKFNKVFILVDESYNANPLSMKSAIKNMDSYKLKNNRKKIIFLGDMLELGKKSKKLHRDLALVINKSSIDRVFVYGKYIKETFNNLLEGKKGKIFNDLKDAHHHFGEIIHNNDILMIKGSNATGLNNFSKNIKKGKISVI